MCLLSKLQSMCSNIDQHETIKSTITRTNNHTDNYINNDYIIQNMTTEMTVGHFHSIPRGLMNSGLAAMLMFQTKDDQNSC